MNSAMKAAVSSDSVSTSIRITDTTINMTRRRIEPQQDQSYIYHHYRMRFKGVTTLGSTLKEKNR